VTVSNVDAIVARAGSALATFREGSLHAALKARYAAAIPDALVEVGVDGFIVDVVGPDELVEIQTASFGSAGRKLERLVETHRVLLVHPITIEKWLVVVDDGGTVLRRRRSPKRGLPLDLFDELVHLSSFVGHPNFRVEIVMTSEEEIRGPIPTGVRMRHPRDWRRIDRRLLAVVETRRIDAPADLAGLLPVGLPVEFTTADIVAGSGRSRRLAMRAAYCLERSGAVVRVGRRGRFVAYRLAPTSSVAPPTPSSDGVDESAAGRLDSRPARRLPATRLAQPRRHAE
jgi:hypothetical protein